jgi:hypothetical protein
VVAGAHARLTEDSPQIATRRMKRTVPPASGSAIASSMVTWV